MKAQEIKMIFRTIFIDIYDIYEGLSTSIRAIIMDGYRFGEF